jgi:molecular chaperone GrpE
MSDTDQVMDPQQQAAPPQPEAEPQEAAGAAGGEAAAEVARLTEELERARRRVDELARAYQTQEREREEFKQRLTRERERMLDVERGNVARLVIEAVDELDRCLLVSGQDGSPLAQGVRMIRDNLLGKLQASGVERLQVVGRPYDPNTAEAADMEVTVNADEDQRVVAELLGGYRLKERIIRPAQVKVAKYVAPAQA